MANRIQIRAGAAVPTTSNLLYRELGYSTGSKQLYINDNGTIRSIGLAEHTHGTYDRASSVLSGANVFSNIVVTDGIVTSTATRALTAADISALPLSGGTMTGAITGAHIKATGTGNDYHIGGFETMGNGTTNTVFPTYGFYQPGLYAASIQLRGATDFRLYAQASTAYASLTALNVAATGSISEGGTALSSKYLGISAKAADSNLLDGYSSASAGTVNTIALRDEAGDIVCRLLRPTYANQSDISGAIAFRTDNSTDNYLRFCSDAAAIRTFIGAAPTSHTHAWTPTLYYPTFTTGWTNWGNGYQPVSYYIDTFNIIHLQGMAQSTSTAQYVFTLPTGWRPAYNHAYTVNYNSVQSNVYITSAGVVHHSNASTSAGKWLSLDGICFQKGA